MDLSSQKFFSKDFSNQDLRGVPMHHSEFICCKFNNADMTDVDASNSSFVGGSMRKTKCTRTNFMNTQLAVPFEPSDCMGMTLTLSCSTFKGMVISHIWWYGWLYFAYLMAPAEREGLDPREKLIALIGQERFDKLNSLFSTRQL